ncbi:MAG TPA: class IV adenylate cyclase [Anaerolineales bacterium]|nr:class IV adenylate cyclase [Anaerolineales bacterium]
MNDQEVEAKFFIKDLKKIETRLQELKARLIQERVHEVNLRFDLPNGSLRADGRVLRLRQDTEARLTYKGASTLKEGVLSRTELEFTVGDFETARNFLEALGYVRFALYEKYRRTYELDGSHIMLDELPYGDFIEIEGANLDEIRATAERLAIHWNAAIPASYLALFDTFCAERGIESDELTFEAVDKLQPTARELDIQAADEGFS